MTTHALELFSAVCGGACILPLMFCLLVPPSSFIVMPRMVSVGEVFTCVDTGGIPDADRYEWKYRLKPNGGDVFVGNGSSNFALTGDVIYG